jgi:hypothetical protein
MDSTRVNNRRQGMDSYRITRDGDRDLTFHGCLIGTGSQGSGGSSGYECDWDVGTEVEIYETRAGTIVTAVRQWSRWQGMDDSHRAAAHTDGASAYRWLLEDCGGESLGRASKEAWTQACENCSLLTGRDVEEVA